MGSHKSVSRGDSHPPGVITDYAEYTEAAAPGTPASGFVRMYTKTDGKAYIKDDAGTETDITGAGGGASLLVHVSTTTFSADSSKDITLPAGYEGGFMLRTLLTGSDTDIQVQCGNTTIDTGSNYDYVQAYSGDTGPSAGTGDGATSMLLAEVTAADCFSIIEISPGYDDSGKGTGFLARSSFLTGTSQYVYTYAGQYQVDAAIDIMRLTAATGTLTGTGVLYGYNI